MRCTLTDLQRQILKQQHSSWQPSLICKKKFFCSSHLPSPHIWNSPTTSIGTETHLLNKENGLPFLNREASLQMLPKIPAGSTLAAASSLEELSWDPGPSAPAPPQSQSMTREHSLSADPDGPQREEACTLLGFTLNVSFSLIIVLLSRNTHRELLSNLQLLWRERPSLSVHLYIALLGTSHWLKTTHWKPMPRSLSTCGATPYLKSPPPSPLPRSVIPRDLPGCKAVFASGALLWSILFVQIQETNSRGDAHISVHKSLP